VLPHPNYLAVVVELAAVPMMFGASITAVVASVANLALLGLVRIPAENAALRAAAAQGEQGR
jgi:methyltransferase